MDSKLKIGLVMSSTREGRLNDRVGLFVQREVEKDHDVVVFDPKTEDLPQTQQLLNLLYNPEVVPDNVKELDEKMQDLDAYIFVSAEYNWTIPPGITNLLANVRPASVCWKPCGIVTYSIGKLGGARVAVDIRKLSGALGMLAVPKQVVLPLAAERIDTDGVVTDKKLNNELNHLLKEIYWAASALKNHKKIVPAPEWIPS